MKEGRIIMNLLEKARVGARLPVQDLARARSFYSEKLGLEPSRTGGEALTYAGPGGEFELFVSNGGSDGSFTQMGWDVEDLDAVVAELRERGVVFEEYDFPGFKTIDGVLEAASLYPDDNGAIARLAWFRDSEGNLLGVGQIVK
jgi:catechol 2,3-dioxygenase-like lactoylglutathione lyase family enzyme